MKKNTLFVIILMVVLLVTIIITGCSKSKDEGKTIGSDYTREQAISDTNIAARELTGEARERNVRQVDTSVTGEITYWT